MYKSNSSFYNILIIFLTSLYLATTTFEVYIPLIKSDVGLWQMLFLNLALCCVINYNSFERFPSGNDEFTNSTDIEKYTFIIQSIVILHYLLFLIGYVFFSINRNQIFDIVIFLLFQSYVYCVGSVKDILSN